MSSPGPVSIDSSSGDTSLRPLRILLVEDYEIDAQILIELLDLIEPPEKPSVTHVRSVAEAQRILAVESYDCVLLDLGLPDGVGVENIESIREVAPRTTIVVMTGLDDDQRAIESLRRGAQEYLVKGRLDHEALMRHLRHAVQRHDLMTNLDQQRELHQRLAGHDPLTGLINRQLLAERAREAISDASRRGERLALSFLDLDGFKAINDRLGHAAGDEVLIQVARALQSAVRVGDVVARLGGDEFVVLQHPAGSDEIVRQTGARMVEAVCNIRQVEGHDVRMGVSVGTAIYPDHGQTFEQLLLHADEVMYTVKRGGGSGMRVGSQPEASTAPAEALDQATLFYQPWISASGEPVGLEALLRQRRGKALFLPESVLQSLERTGESSALTRWLLHTSLTQWMLWRRAGLSVHRLAVNMSAVEVGQAEFPDEIEAALGSAGAGADTLQIEIAEHLLDAPSPQLLDNLRGLRARGVRVVIDRFGRDHGALRKLVGLPIDGVKLDCSVVHGLGTDDIGCRALVAGVVQAARVRGIDVVAVGVEHDAQVRRCLQLECSAMQGSWVAAPVESTQVLAVLADCARRAPLLVRPATFAPT